MLLDEKYWYEKEGIEVPNVPFFNNDKILGDQSYDIDCLYSVFMQYKFIKTISDIFDHKKMGIFTLLDSECIMREPSTEKFMDRLVCTWEKHTAFNRTNMSHLKKFQLTKNSFIIRHFAGDVPYSTVCLNNLCECKYIVFIIKDLSYGRWISSRKIVKVSQVVWKIWLKKLLICIQEQRALTKFQRSHSDQRLRT